MTALRSSFVPLHDPRRRAELDARVKEVLAALARKAAPDALDQKIEAFRSLETLSAS